jgi:hypothetical protein
MSSTPLAIVALSVIVATLAIFAYDIITRRWDAISWRNLFLLGFLHFYGMGCWFAARGYVTRGVPNQQTGLGLMAAGTALFFALFMVTTWWAVRWRWTTRFLPSLNLPITGPGVIGSAIILLGLAFLGATIIQLSYAGALIAFLRGQLAATAVGLATYYLIARRFNPLAWSLFIGTLLAAVLIGVVGSSGRRMLLGSLLAVPWMWFFTVWRYRGAAANFGRVGIGALIGFLAVIVYTPIRFQDAGKMAVGATIGRRIDQLSEIVQDPLALVNQKIIDSIVYTDAPSNTNFIIENYPENYPYTPGAGLLWMAANPIPRSIWPGKPEALGVIIQEQMHAPSNLGPGIVGHGWAEGGFLGIAGYAIAFGVIAAVIDRALAVRAWNPFFVAVIGSNLGNIFGLARGDTPLFLLEFLSGVVLSVGILYIIKLTYGPIAAAFPPLWTGLPGIPTEGPDHDHEDDGAFGGEYPPESEQSHGEPTSAG